MQKIHRKIESNGGAIPYWFVVLQLTMLSAYLLIKKPKTSTQKKITEPIVVEGK